MSRNCWELIGLLSFNLLCIVERKTMMNFMLLSCLAATYDRRQFLPSLSILFSPSLGVSDQDNRVENDSTKLADNGGYKITLPIERYYGGTNCIRVSVSGIPQKFRGRVLQPTRIYKMVLDTGSPYFVIPHDSPEAKDDNSIYLGVILEDVTDSSRDDIDGTSQRNSAFPLSFKELIVDLFYSNEEARRRAGRPEYGVGREMKGCKLRTIRFQLRSGSRT